MKTNLQAMRKAAGFTSARAFAEHFGISVNTYTGYEQGKPMSLEVAWELADALDCSLDDLAGRKRPRKAFSDQRQEALNGHYESLNDDSKTALVDFAKSYAADPERRMVKERKDVRDQAAMGA